MKTQKAIKDNIDEAQITFWHAMGVGSETFFPRSLHTTSTQSVLTEPAAFMSYQFEFEGTVPVNSIYWVDLQTVGHKNRLT